MTPPPIGFRLPGSDPETRNAFAVAGIAPRLLQEDFALEDITGLARKLLREQQKAHHTDVGSAGSRSHARSVELNDALSDLDDSPTVLAQIREEYLRNHPFAAKLQNIFAAAHADLETHSLLSRFVLRELERDLSSFWPHALRVPPGRLTLVDPFSAAEALRALEIRYEARRNTEFRDQEAALYKKALEFPDEATRQRWLEKVIDENSRHPFHPDVRVIELFMHKYPDIEAEIRAGLRHDFPPDLLRPLRDEYCKTSEYRLFLRDMEQAALDRYQRENTEGGFIDELEAEFELEMKEIEEERAGYMGLESAVEAFERVKSENSFGVTVTKEGHLLLDGVKEPPTGEVVLLGTLFRGRSLQTSTVEGSFKDPTVEISETIFGAYEELGREVPNLRHLTLAELAPLFSLFESSFPEYLPFSRSLRVGATIETGALLVAAVIPPDGGAPYCTVLGEVVAFEPLAAAGQSAHSLDGVSGSHQDAAKAGADVSDLPKGVKRKGASASAAEPKKSSGKRRSKK